MSDEGSVRKIAVIGGHTEVSKLLMDVVEERDLPVDLIRYTTSDHLDEGLELLGPEAMGAGELIVMAFSGSLAEGIGAGALKLNKAIVDLTGAVEDAEALWPVLDPNAKVEAGKVVAVRPGIAGPVVAVLRALSSWAIERVTVATYESAAVADRAGIDELLDQVRAVYTMKDVKNPVFDAQLAFNVLTQHPMAEDAELVAAIEEGLDSPPDIRVRRAIVPTLGADAATLYLDFVDAPDPEALVAAINGARGIRHIEDAVHPLAAVDRSDTLVGQVVADGAQVSLTLAVDRLRATAALPATLLIERWLEG